MDRRPGSNSDSAHGLAIAGCGQFRLNQSTSSLRRKTAGVYVEMMRLPEGIWLPRVVRINGADYQKLFDGINTESVAIFSNHIRFSTEIKDVKIDTPSNP